jgi:hypothetical protein
MTRVAANPSIPMAADDRVPGDGSGDIDLSISGKKVIWSRKKNSAAARR